MNPDDHVVVMWLSGSPTSTVSICTKLSGIPSLSFVPNNSYAVTRLGDWSVIRLSEMSVSICVFLCILRYPFIFCFVFCDVMVISVSMGGTIEFMTFTSYFSSIYTVSSSEHIFCFLSRLHSWMSSHSLFLLYCPQYVSSLLCSFVVFCSIPFCIVSCLPVSLSHSPEYIHHGIFSPVSMIAISDPVFSVISISLGSVSLDVMISSSIIIVVLSWVSIFC